MAAHLRSISVVGVPGLPDLDVALQPLTALIGPRATGKSRLLTAIAWLLTGEPDIDGDASSARVTGELSDATATRRLERSSEISPAPPLPEVRFLRAHERVPRQPAEGPRGSAAAAEAMLADIAEQRLAGTQGQLLLIEEPELMLTPQQQRHLYGLLRRFSEHNQVIYSTRSPAMVDAAHYHEIVRLDRTATGTRARRASVEVLSDEERLRLAAEFDRERTEMFFATAVVIVEGQTERQALPLIFERLGYDPDALGISIVEVGGKSNMPLVAKVLSELHIPHVLVFDADTGRPAEAENANLRRIAGSAPVFALDPDFEGAAKIKKNDDKVLDAWRHFSAIEPKRIPRPFRDIVRTTVALADLNRA